LDVVLPLAVGGLVVAVGGVASLVGLVEGADGERAVTVVIEVAVVRELGINTSDPPCGSYMNGFYHHHHHHHYYYYSSPPWSKLVLPSLSSSSSSSSLSSSPPSSLLPLELIFLERAMDGVITSQG